MVLNFVDDVNDDITSIFPQIDYKKLIEDNERADGDMANLIKLDACLKNNYMTEKTAKKTMPSECHMNVERSSSHDKIVKRNYRGNGVKSNKSSAESSRASTLTGLIFARINFRGFSGFWGFPRN